MISAAAVASAGEYTFRYYGNESEHPGELINDILTDKFIDRFPSDKWMIVVHTMNYGNKGVGRVVHATIGISPASKAPQMPRITYFAYRRIGTLIEADLRNLQLEAERAALGALMKDCANTSKCEVHKPY